MNPVDALRVALRAIAANRLRTALTALGMFIGVASVIVLIAVGQGAQQGVTERIRGLGTNLVFVRPAPPQSSSRTGPQAAPGSTQTLTKSDADALAEGGVPGLVGVAPQISFGAQAIVGGLNASTTIIGTTEAYPNVRDVTVRDGEFVSSLDVERRASSAVLGSKVAATLFPDGDAVGSTVRIALGGRTGFNFRVIGVMAERGGVEGGDQDSYIFVPVTTMQNRIGAQRNPTGEIIVNQISVKLQPKADQEAAKAAISELLLRRHAVAEADFQVQSQNDLIGAADEVRRTLSILLGSVAGISLVVGAIGVMNIMLVSVTERTREIGIRRAVGARRRDILLQFVVESLALCLLGGLLGILAGVGVAYGVDGRTISGQAMVTVIQPWSIAVALAVALATGLLSGIYPAQRASAVDPIVALRSE